MSALFVRYQTSSVAAALRMPPEARAAQISEEYGLGIATFSHGVLSVLERALSSLPKEHLQGGAVCSIERGEEITACYYDSQSCKIYIGALLLTTNWYRGRVAHPDTMPNSQTRVTHENDMELGLNFNKRDVFGGISDAISRSNLLESSLLHEIGHAVDSKINWTQTVAKLPAFGGWEIYDRDKAEDMSRVQSALGDRPKALQIAKSHPWQFADGCQSSLAQEGRIYQRDLYGEWTSYLACSRDTGVSNYQFSAAREWFAEAYAGFYSRLTLRSIGQLPAHNRLGKLTLDFFTHYLGTEDISPALADPVSGEMQSLLYFENDVNEWFDYWENENNVHKLR